MKTLLWLDDYRDPMEGQWLTFSPITLDDLEVHWVKSYEDFVSWILKNGLPTGICFDHDLGGDIAMDLVNKGVSKRKARKVKQQFKSGFDAAKWLVNYCLDNKLSLPLYNIQSANPVGKKNIDLLLKQFNGK